MTGETDLRAILATMEPNLSDVEFAFATFADPAAAASIEGVLATFAEDEGLSIVAPASALVAAEVPDNCGWAKISLTVHSSLEAVGLTAAIASTLTERGISANIIAAYFHDHVFVPWEQRHQAMAALTALASASVLHR